MEFFLEQHSALPPHAQIQEQIKLALLLGRLRPGDTLPSIRDVEKEIGISRGVVRKAYLSLQRSGILSMRHGKGVIVESQLKYSESASMKRDCEQLSNYVLRKLETLGVSPCAFARYLYQRARQVEANRPFVLFVDATEALALQRAAQISSAWRINVCGVSIDQLSNMATPEIKKFGRILTNYFRVDEVRQLTSRSGVDVIAVGFAFPSAMAKEFRHLKPGDSVVLVLADQDYPSLRLIVDLYRKMLVDPSISIDAIPLSRITNFRAFIRSGRYAKVIFSNRIWESVPDQVRRHPTVTRPLMEVDLVSLESARIDSGVVL